MFERSALYARKDGRVEQLRHRSDLAFLGFLAPRVFEILADEDDASARSAQRLVGGRGDDVRVFQRIVQQARGFTKQKTAKT